MRFVALVVNLPWNIVGMLLALISLPRKIIFNRSPFAFVVHVRSFWWQIWLASHKGVRASSIGNIILLGGNLQPKDLEHELVHVHQYEQRPFIQAFLYVLETLRHGYKNNKYEIEAYEKAGNKYEKASESQKHQAQAIRGIMDRYDPAKTTYRLLTIPRYYGRN